jgi:FAD/FMN-containing dehydrogenase
LVRSGNAQYTVAHQLFIPRFDTIMPAAIAYCASPADVQACLAFAQKFALPLVPRCGGHSYAGYSTTTGIVVDVTRMSTVTVNTGNATTVVGAGAHLIDVYAALTQYGLIIPAGSCPVVGIAGLTLGGGVGVIGRKFGLTSDNMLSAQIVTASGHILTCDANHYPDLFWALRGGGGGNFGVVTSFTFQAHAVPTISLFTLYWPWSSAVSVMSAWQNWAPQGPDELWSNCVLDSPANKSGPIVLVNGVYVGGVAALNSLLHQLTSRINTAPSSSYVSGAGLLDTMLVEAGCYGKSVSQCHLPSQNPQGQLQRDTYTAKADYFTTPLPSQGIEALVNAVETRHTSSLGEGGIGFDAFGGAINRVPADATAFAHRNTLFSAQYTASWNANDAASIVAANRAWLINTWQSVRAYASGGSYVNYIDPDLPNWQAAYYGSNLPRLQKIKNIYDPNNFFHFAQSIPPA